MSSSIPGSHLDADLALALEISSQEYYQQEQLPGYSTHWTTTQQGTQQGQTSQNSTIVPILIPRQDMLHGDLIVSSTQVEKEPKSLPSLPSPTLPSIQKGCCCGKKGKCLKCLNGKDVAAIVSWILFMDLLWISFWTLWTIVFSTIFTTFLIIPIVGVPFFVGFAYTWRGLAKVDVQFLHHLLKGKRKIPSIKLNCEKGLMKKFKCMVKNRITWTSIIYAWFRLIFGIFTFTCCVICLFVVWPFTCFCVKGNVVFRPVLVMVLLQRDVGWNLLFGKGQHVDGEDVVRI